MAGLFLLQAPVFSQNLEGILRLVLASISIAGVVMGLVYKVYILPTEKELKRLREETIPKMREDYHNEVRRFKDEILPDFREQQKSELNGLGARLSKTEDRMSRVEERVNSVESAVNEVRLRLGQMGETLGEIKRSSDQAAKASTETQVLIARFDERLKLSEQRRSERA